MAAISPTPRAGTWLRIDHALAPFPQPRAGTWLGIEGSLSSAPRAGTWLRIVGQPGTGTVRAGTWIRIDSVDFGRRTLGAFGGVPVGHIGAYGVKS